MIESLNNELEIEIEELEEEIIIIIEEYLENNIRKYSSPEFYEKMGEEIIDYITKTYFPLNDLLEKEKDSLLEFIWNTIDDIIFYYDIPKRQQQNIELVKNENDYENITKSLRELNEINQLQPKQRTTEWYQYRYNRFSASSIWKLLSTLSQYNSLILEKCKNPQQATSVTNHNNPRNWGVKYEPVSIMIYEDKYPTTIVKTDYGCIPHPIYPFIAASPDGINISPECPEKYGRMVEVKNIYNRDITGIPLEEYWIQMQIQMETCGLEVCDFLETRFKEYSCEEDFYSDISPEYKGVILFLLGKDSTIENRFEYMPLYVNLEKKHVDKWIQEFREKVSDTHLIYEIVYWYLDEYSCVVVERNALWFESVLPVFEEAWNIVVSERTYGCKHREPKHRELISHISKNSSSSSSSKICVVKLE
jgi:putative phage-type endonuclease